MNPGGYVVFFDGPPATLSAVGGKARNLWRLALAGLPIPAAFAVVTAAHEEVVQSAGLAPGLSALAELYERDQIAKRDRPDELAGARADAAQQVGRPSATRPRRGLRP